MNNFANGKRYLIYGYSVKLLQLRLHSSQNLTPKQKKFNNSVKAIRQAVEWDFGIVLKLC